MGLQDTVSAERISIGFFGMRNAGKSSLVNAVTGQQLSVVSDVKGTTTDPVKKAMELLPLGPVVIIDTPGLDDEGELGLLRVQKTKEILTKVDIAVLVVDATVGLSAQDKELVDSFKERKIPYVIAYNKVDLICGENVGSHSAGGAGSAMEKTDLPDGDAYVPHKKAALPVDAAYVPHKKAASVSGCTASAPEQATSSTAPALFVSATTGEGIHALKETLGTFAQKTKKTKVLVADLLEPGDIVVLVTPIDASAPKGRLILPQQLTIRDILDAHGIVVTCQDTELPQTLAGLARKPKMVITDSQAFGRVSKDTPSEIPLTSFSILMARYKGDLTELVKGAAALSRLHDGDKVLISEGCTHHRQCNDIGTVKMPQWITDFTGVEPEFTFTSGGEFPEDLSAYALIVHCGGCMLNETEMQHRIEKSAATGVPIVNYGIAIAQMHGILKRSVELFPDVLKLLD